MSFFGNRTLDDVNAKLTVVLRSLHRMEVRFMGAYEDMTALLAANDTNLNAIAARIQALVDQIGTGLTAAQADAIKQGLTTEAAKIAALTPGA